MIRASRTSRSSTRARSTPSSCRTGPTASWSWERTGKGGHLIALIKPQFEATRAEADKAQGIIKDPVIHARVVEGLTASIQSLPGSKVLGVIPSPIEGRDGNKEFLIAVKRA
jgi:23S rRNA (cytidine1920-2'-O)/16S rRNA (cytidine1409-2'-O)-methyltransferase